MHQLLLKIIIITSAPPVECIEHLYCYEDREGHGHWVEIIEYFAVGDISKIRVVRGALQVVGL